MTLNRGVFRTSHDGRCHVSSKWSDDMKIPGSVADSSGYHMTPTPGSDYGTVEGERLFNSQHCGRWRN